MFFHWGQKVVIMMFVVIVIMMLFMSKVVRRIKQKWSNPLFIAYFLYYRAVMVLNTQLLITLSPQSCRFLSSAKQSSALLPLQSSALFNNHYIHQHCLQSIVISIVKFLPFSDHWLPCTTSIFSLKSSLLSLNQHHCRHYHHHSMHFHYDLHWNHNIVIKNISQFKILVSKTRKLGTFHKNTLWINTLRNEHLSLHIHFWHLSLLIHFRAFKPPNTFFFYFSLFLLGGGGDKDTCLSKNYWLKVSIWPKPK